MGLFSSKSKSTSTTNVYDQSQNFAIDFGGGELGGGSDKNMIAGGNITVDGFSEETANALISAITQTNNTFVDGSLDFVNEAGKTTNDLIDGTIDITKQLTNSTTSLINAILGQSNNLFNDTFKWIQETIGSSQQQTEFVTSSLAQAYNSEQATNSAFKTYALYGLIGFVAWVYWGRK